MVETQANHFKYEFDSVEEALKDFGKFYIAQARVVSEMNLVLLMSVMCSCQQVCHCDG